MSNIWIIIKNILKRMYRKPSSYLLHFLAPIIVSVSIFLMYNIFSTTPISIGIVNEDQSQLSRVLIRNIESNEGLEVVLIDAQDLEDRIIERYVSYGVVIPENFESDILNEVAPKTEIVSFDQNSGAIWIKGLTNFHIENMMLLSKATNDKSEVLLKMDQLENSFYSFESIGITDLSKEKTATVNTFGTYMIVLLITTFTISFQILKEKEQGTFSRIGISPIHPKSYVLANIIANLMISSAQIGIVMLVLKLGFKVNFFTNPFILYFILVLFALCGISVGVLLATLSKNTQTASAALGLILSPSCMIAGCLWPLDSMPEFMQKIAYITPQRWTLDAIELIQKNNQVLEIIPNLLVVLSFTTLFFLISIYKIKNEDQLFY